MKSLHAFIGQGNAYFDMSKSGAMLAWEYFHPAAPPPRLIEYIQDRDLWRWDMPYSREFSAGLGLLPFDFDTYLRLETDPGYFDGVIERGDSVLSYIDKMVGRAAERATRRTYRGMDVLVVNSPQWVSEIGAQLSSDCDFAMIWSYSHENNEVRVSLRSSERHGADVSIVASDHGGGGHSHAAGFKLAGCHNVEHLFVEGGV
jgi:oligoribonuclease NrnB/cAMP/cGMP phosphodiesterase (DHH superfamily)